MSSIKNFTLFFLLFSFCVNKIEAKQSPHEGKRNIATNKKDFAVINALVMATDTLGDQCLEDRGILSDNVEAERVIDLSLWLWHQTGVDKSEMALNLECFQRANSKTYTDLFEKLDSGFQEELKNEIEKARKRKKSGNA
ncbi:MAG: hypothetical protein R3A80_01860 [Bdellovibrionota bacterium]